MDGFLHDYASAADAYLTLAGTVDWLEPGRSGVYLERALALLDGALNLFVDPHGPGFFFTAEGISTPVARRKEWFDNATPSGNGGGLLHALSGAYALTGEGRYAEVFAALLPAYTDGARKVASGVAHGLEAAAVDTAGIGVISVRSGVDLEALREALAERTWRRTFVRVSDVALPEDYELCVGTRCGVPTSDVSVLLERLLSCQFAFAKGGARGESLHL